MAVKRGLLSPDASDEKRIQIMQRKANMGMNAILSLSLALARLKGAMQGKNLCDIIRDEMSITMAKTIASQFESISLNELQERMTWFRRNMVKYEKFTADCMGSCKNTTEENGWLTADDEKSIDDEVNGIVLRIKEGILINDKDLWEVLWGELSFTDLNLGLQLVNEKVNDVPLYILIRKQLPVYDV